MALHDAKLTDYAVFGSTSLEGIEKFIDMKTPGTFLNQNNHWACYSQIRVGGYYGSGGEETNPYYFCHYSMGGFEDLIVELRSRLTNIRFELLSENKFSLVSSVPTAQQSRWGSSGSMYLVKGDKIPDEYQLIGEVMFPVYSVTYSEEYTPKALAHMNYYMGVSMRNSAYAEIHDTSPCMFSSDTSYGGRVKIVLSHFRESENKLKTLLEWSTGKENGHSTCDKKITEEQWLLIDNPELVNKTVTELGSATQTGFFCKLAGIERKGRYD